MTRIRRIMTLVCVFATALFVGGGCGPRKPEAPAGGPSFPGFDADARAGKRLTVAFFGASLTWGANATDQARTSYRAHIARRLEARYPDARFTFIDGAIGGTGSNLGVFRLQRDCLRYEPDLVFLDFSANDDLWSATPEQLEPYESLVRRIVTEGNCPVVPVIFPFQWNSAPGSADQFAGRLAHIEIAEAYRAPVGDAVLYIQELAEKDAGLVARIWNIDAVHPGDYGYRLFADAAWQGFETGLRDGMVCRAPATMLNNDTYMTWSRNRISRLEPLPKGWEVGPVSRTAAWHDGLMSRWLDDVVIARNMVQATDMTAGKAAGEPILADPITLKFRAASVLVFGEETVKSGKYMALIDGEAVTHGQGDKTVAEFDLNSGKMGGGRQHYAMLATGLDPDVVHTLEIRPVFSKEEQQELRLESICLAGGAARIVD